MSSPDFAERSEKKQGNFLGAFDIFCGESFSHIAHIGRLQLQAVPINFFSSIEDFAKVNVFQRFYFDKRA